MHSLVEQISMFAEFSMPREDERAHFQSLLGRLSKSIATLEQNYMNRLKEMEAKHDSSFSEIFIQKNEEIVKLRLEIDNLSRLKKVTSPRKQDELSEAKEEIQRLNGIVQQQKDEINQLLYKVLDAQTFIESLEKANQMSQSIDIPELHQNIQLANEHFKIIKQALLANRRLFKAIQLKKLLP